MLILINKFNVFLQLVGEYVDMIKARIVDPLKFIRIALVDAAR
jgi:chaperonin GroEL (HSP60 family)